MRSGIRLHLIPLGNKGDWSYLVPAWTFVQVFKLLVEIVEFPKAKSVFEQSYVRLHKASSGHFTRSYRRCAKGETSKQPSQGICHLCLAGSDGFDFEDLLLALLWGTPFASSFCNVDLLQGLLFVLTLPLRSACPAYKRTMDQELPWNQEPLFITKLMHQVTRKAAFFKIDAFHTINLGVAKVFGASSLVYLSALCHGSSIEDRLADLTAYYLEYCKAPWILRGAGLTISMCHHEPCAHKFLPRQTARPTTLTKSTRPCWGGKLLPQMARGTKVLFPLRYAFSSNISRKSEVWKGLRMRCSASLCLVSTNLSPHKCWLVDFAAMLKAVS